MFRFHLVLLPSFSLLYSSCCFSCTLKHFQLHMYTGVCFPFGMILYTHILTSGIKNTFPHTGHVAVLYRSRFCFSMFIPLEYPDQSGVYLQRIRDQLPVVIREQDAVLPYHLLQCLDPCQPIRSKQFRVPLPDFLHFVTSAQISITMAVMNMASVFMFMLYSCQFEMNLMFSSSFFFLRVSASYCCL